MAAFLDCGKRTLERRYGAVIEKGREGMKLSLRRMQYQTADKGNVAMQIWLGKQYLGQREPRDNVIDTINTREVARQFAQMVHATEQGLRASGDPELQELKPEIRDGSRGPEELQDGVREAPDNQSGDV